MLKVYAHLQGTTIFGFLALFSKGFTTSLALLAIGLAFDLAIYLLIYRKRLTQAHEARRTSARNYVCATIVFAVVAVTLSTSSSVHEVIGEEVISSYVKDVSYFFPTIERHSRALLVRNKLYEMQYTAIFDSLQFMFLITFVV